MQPLLFVVLLAVFAGVVFGMLMRDPKGDRRALSILRRVIRWNDPDHAIIGRAGSAVIAISFERETITLGDAKHRSEYPFGRIVQVEGIRDGIVLRRMLRGSPYVEPATDGPSPPPDRIKSLSLGIKVDDPDHQDYIIEFFDEPGRGARPDDPAFRRNARELEVWYGYVANAISRSAPGGVE